MHININQSFFSRGFDEHKTPKYDFTALDNFLDIIIEIHLFPVIEFMGNIFPRNNLHDIRFMWKDLTNQLISHFVCTYLLENLRHILSPSFFF